MAENNGMVLHGRIENGTVVLTDPVALPNGAEVTVIIPSTASSSVETQRRVQLPLVASKNPGSRQLSGDDVANLLSQDDISS